MNDVLPSVIPVEASSTGRTAPVPLCDILFPVFGRNILWVVRVLVEEYRTDDLYKYVEISTVSVSTPSEVGHPSVGDVLCSGS